MFLQRYQIYRFLGNALKRILFQIKSKIRLLEIGYSTYSAIIKSYLPTFR